MHETTARKRRFSEQVVPGIVPNLQNSRDNNANAIRSSLDSNPSTQITNPFDDVNYPIPDFERVYSRMRDPENGFCPMDRRWRLVNYPKCFVGTEAVQWMVENLSLDREAAIKTGQRLMDAGILHHVTNSEAFCDEYYFYRFQEDNDTSVLNMKRVWDPHKPTRHAVDVSKNLLTKLALLCEEYRKRIIEAKQQKEASSKNDAPSTPNLNRPEPMFTSPTLPSTPVFPDALRQTTPFHTPPLQQPPLNRQSSLPTTGVSSRHASSSSLFSKVKYEVGDDVDFSTLAKSEDFRKYTLAAAELQRVQLVALNDDERIAFFVNVYNALCLHGHVIHGVPNNLYRRYIFFRALSYRVAGLDMTLDDIEHGILRGNKRPPMIRFLQQLRPHDPKCQHVLMKSDERIHFVISAGTRSDPPIRILDGENVQEELYHSTIEFLGYSVTVDVASRTVTLPRIFLWYAEDFPTPEKALLEWVTGYLPPEACHQLTTMLKDDQKSVTVSYKNFDWSNAEARFNATVVRRKRRKLERQAATNQNSMNNSTDGEGLFSSFLSSSPNLENKREIPNAMNFLASSSSDKNVVPTERRDP